MQRVPGRYAYACLFPGPALTRPGHQHIPGPVSPARSWKGSVAKFDFWGKIQKLGIRNSMSYRLPNVKIRVPHHARQKKWDFPKKADIPLAYGTDSATTHFR